MYQRWHKIAIFAILIIRSFNNPATIMNISLTPELEKYVHDKVNCGLYTSASEVIRESLRLMHNYDDLQKHKIVQLNQAIDVGLNELKSGKKSLASESYTRLKKKINTIVKGKK